MQANLVFVMYELIDKKVFWSRSSRNDNVATACLNTLTKLIHHTEFFQRKNLLQFCRIQQTIRSQKCANHCLTIGR